MTSLIALHNGSQSLEPLSTEPSVEDIDTSLGLVKGYHVTCTVNAHECKVARALHLANLVTAHLEVCSTDTLVGLAARPFKSISPRSVSEPIANEICRMLVTFTYRMKTIDVCEAYQHRRHRSIQGSCPRCRAPGGERASSSLH